jgi:polyisoprenoid-binding protein YceI
LAVAVACAGLLAACAPRRAEAPAQPPSARVSMAIPKGARVYDVDPRRSIVTIRVYRAGPLAKLGHNHVITSGEEYGVVWQGREPSGSGFELHVPVVTLVVDDAAARAAAGPDFEGAVPDSAREGTYQNMLRPEVLDGKRFPQVVVQCAALGGTWNKTVASADVTLKGVTRRVEVPVAIGQADGTLTARGSFHILQSDFGITPFSVGGGAIQVADRVDLSFEIVATAR